MTWQQQVRAVSPGATTHKPSQQQVRGEASKALAGWSHLVLLPVYACPFCSCCRGTMKV